jgi:pyridoxine 5-phosphate synthase
MAILSVNVDHVATLRQARRTVYPDPVEAARLAEAAGAAGITAHLRVDRRHIQDEDVARLKETVAGKLNLETSTDPDILKVALEHLPHQVTLVPERPDEVTTEGGLDLRRQGSSVGVAARGLSRAGIWVSVFLDPDPEQIALLGELRSDVGDEVFRGFEINTDAYTKASSPDDVATELAKIRRTVDRGVELGFAVYAGHGLTPANVGPIAAMEEIEELNIGHAIVSRAVLVGMEEAVREMLAAMAAG